MKRIRILIGTTLSLIVSSMCMADGLRPFAQPGELFNWHEGDIRAQTTIGSEYSNIQPNGSCTPDSDTYRRADLLVNIYNEKRVELALQKRVDDLARLRQRCEADRQRIEERTQKQIARHLPPHVVHGSRPVGFAGRTGFTERDSK